MALVARAIATEVGRTEGPVIRPDGEIIFTSMDRGLLYSIKNGGKPTVFSEPGHFPNGATEGIDGTIYITQGGGHKRWGPGAGVGGIQAIAHDGSVRYVTKDPIAPNDLCFGPDGLLYLTDPTRPRPERNDGRLFRCDVKTGEAELLCTVPWYTNGIGFGLDNALYVARAVERHRDQPGIMRFPLDNGRLGKGEMFAKMDTGRPDGFLFDVDGNLIIGANSDSEKPGSIQTFDRNGKYVDAFTPSPGRSTTNVALGPDRVLIITATDLGAVFAVDGWPKAGLPLYPFRKAG